MSSLWAIVAVLGVFGAVVLGGVAVQLATQDRRRTASLAARVGPVPDLRERALARSFGERVGEPALRRLRSLGAWITPKGAYRRIEHRLALAGNPASWDVEKVVALRLGGALAGLFGGGVLGGAVRGGLAMPAAVLFGTIGFVLPGAFLGARAAARQKDIRRSLPDTMDLLGISVEAGLGFDAALGHVATAVPGALSEEIGRTLHEMQLGVSRSDALRHLADRTDVDELDSFALAMAQADEFGVSVRGVLRSQSKELRVKRRQRAEAMAMKTPVKLVFPLIFCVLPAIFVVVAGPGVINIARSFFGLG
jgi:tight adherence protein C